MKLSQLFSVFTELKWGADPLKDVSSICFDSRKLEPGCVFVAIRGERHDGHVHAAEAANAGAIGLVLEDDKYVPDGYKGAIVVVANTRSALNDLSSRFYGMPADRMYCVGVTGTNGKTTVTHMIEAIMNEFGWPTGVVGTINHHLGQHVWNTEMTTPDPLSFQKRLSEFVALGAQALALEVSSHALVQRRVDSVSFDAVVFTNLSRDHLDYHRDLDDYFQAKSRLFSEILPKSTKSSKFAIVNHDDPYGGRIEAQEGVVLRTYGTKDADFTFTILQQDFCGTRFHLKTRQGEREFHLGMPGMHNVYNAVAAIAVGVGAGASLETCARALENLPGVKGRLEAIGNVQGIHVFVDYAHTDDALRAVLRNLNEVRRDGKIRNRLITVFGCGGDRDKGKRPLMMKAALEGSDLVIVTSDNPRTEDPKRIIDDALSGAPAEEIGKSIIVEVDRRKAIELALSGASLGDVVLIAGKGHETYQQIGLVKHDFSDAKVVKEYFKCLGKSSSQTS